MGFTIESYGLFGLVPQSFYVSIQGSYVVKKNQPTPGAYLINYTVYYSSGKNSQLISEKATFTITQAMPTPADVYVIIYEDIKLNLDPNYGTDRQTLVFNDDHVSRKRNLENSLQSHPLADLGYF